MWCFLACSARLFLPTLYLIYHIHIIMLHYVHLFKNVLCSSIQNPVLPPSSLTKTSLFVLSYVFFLQGFHGCAQNWPVSFFWLDYFYFMPVSWLSWRDFPTVLVCTGACNSSCQLISAKHTALKKDDVKFPDCVSSPATKVILDFFWSNDCVRRVCFLACSLPQPIHHQCTLFQWGDRNRQ